MMKRWKCTVCGQVFVSETPPAPCPICGAGEDAFIELPDEVGSSFRRDTLDRFVIIGGGGAGLEAARAIRARNLTCTIQLIAGEGLIPYNRPALTDALADGMSFDSIALEPYDYYGLHNIELITSAKAESVNVGGKRVLLTDGRALAYDKLLIATGALPFNPIPSEDHSIPCFTLRNYVDMQAIASQCAGKRAILVGGGILGLEAALALRESGALVTVYELADRALPLQADARASEMITGALGSEGISIITGKSVARFTPTGAILSDGTTADADFALISIGVRSDVAIARTMGAQIDRGIIVDEFMRTSIPDVFAAGDCAQFQGRATCLWAAAVGQGQIAGAAMCMDQSVPYEPIVPATSFEVGSVSLFSAGSLLGKEHMTHINELSGVYRRLYFTDGKLVGAVFVNDTSRSASAISLIASGAKPERAKDIL